MGPGTHEEEKSRNETLLTQHRGVTPPPGQSEPWTPALGLVGTRPRPLPAVHSGQGPAVQGRQRTMTPSLSEASPGTWGSQTPALLACVTSLSLSFPTGQWGEHGGPWGSMVTLQTQPLVAHRRP